MSPTLLIILLIITANAALAHVLWGQRWLQLLLFWLAAAIGTLIAMVASFFGVMFPLDLPTPAGIPVLESVMGEWLCLIIASRLRV